ncbi:MAG: GNAT family N-acetyltransferase [Anaerolineales bacterium]|nr:GNAT family N-acetyltransferase [Anaerolineales bacterium]
MIFHIRPAQLNDAAALADLLTGLGWFQHYFGDAPAEVIQERVRQKLSLNLTDKSHSIYVAESSESRIAGYAAVHWLPYLFLPGPEGFVSELFVQESARGQGLGGRLLAAVKAEAIERGCSRLSLINMRSRESYQRGFYGQHGWEERPEAANFILRLPQASQK